MSNQDEYEIDFERTANAPIAEGIHTFRIKAIEEGTSKEKEGGGGGNPMWTVTLVCLTPSEDNKELRTWLVLTQEARWKLEEFLDAVGAPTEGAGTASSFVGRQLQAQVIHEPYHSAGYPRVESFVVPGIPYDEIIKKAVELSADLVVVGTHGRTGLDHVLFGSTAEKVVRKSPVPVMTIRPGMSQPGPRTQGSGNAAFFVSAAPW